MITEFRDNYRWLSNFWPCEIQFRGINFLTVEHGYMSAKSDDLEWKKFCSDPNNSPTKVKRKSRKIVLREDWDSIKIDVMRELLVLKFSQEPFKKLLLETGDRYIQEGNRWGDTFWGVCLKTNTGSNNLGKLIMEIREELRNQESKVSLYQIFTNRVFGFIRRMVNFA